MSVELPLKCTQIMRFHHGPVLCIAYDVDGEYSLSGGQDKFIYLSRPYDAKAIQKYEGHHWDVLDVKSFSDHSKFCSVSVDKGLFVWDVLEARVIRKYYGHTGRVHSVDVNEEGTVAFTGAYDATVRIWDLKSSSKFPMQILSDAKDSVSTIVFDELQSQIFTGCIDGHFRIYDIRKGLLSTVQYGYPITYFSLLSESSLVLLSSLEAPLRLYDLKNGQLLNEYSGHLNTKYKCASTFNYAENTVISGSEDNCIYLWDFIKNDKLTLLKGHTQAVCSVAAHPSKNQILSASIDGSIRLWE